MAILQKVSIFSNERFDASDARSIETFAQTDWSNYLKGVLTERSMLWSGFQVTNFANIFISPGVYLSQNDVALIHSEASTQAQGFYVSAGTESDFQLVLNPSSTNFVEVDLKLVSGTPDTRAFWSPSANGGAGGEYTDTVDTVINLYLSIDVNVTGFTSGRVPLYKIVTNSSGIVTSITDCRNMMGRLGSGGTSPNPDNNFSFPNLPDSSHSRIETPVTATSATLTNAPFQGGDKNLKSLKDWMDAMMTNVKEMKSVPYWYMKPQASSAQSYQNSAMTLLIGGDYIHSATNTGFLSMTGGSAIVRMGGINSSIAPFANINLNSNNALYCLLSTDESAAAYHLGQDGLNPILPQNIIAISSNSITVNNGGNYITTAGNIVARGQVFSYSSYNAATGVFFNVSPDPSGMLSSGLTVYQDIYNSVGYLHQSPSGTLPGQVNGVSEGAERVFWISYFDGTSTIFVRDAQLVPGESAVAGNLGSDQLFQYIGSSGSADNTPIYNVNSIANGTDLTTAIKDAFKIIETPIYDEKIFSSTGWASGSVVTLPVNSKTSTPGLYTMNTDELQVFENGIMLQKGYDYTETTASSITLSRDVYLNTTLRFRISSIGGAGAASGVGVRSNTLQAAYSNGQSITVASGQPIVINGPSTQKLLQINGNLGVTGMIDPTGLTFIPQATSPIPAGKAGFWVDTASGELNYTDVAQNVINVSATVQNINGDAASFARTATNNQTYTIPAGVPVCLVGPRSIDLASAATLSQATFFGITVSSIAPGSSGKVIYAGVVPGIFTGTGLAEGYIWLSDTPGVMSISAPTAAGSYLRIIGIIDGDDLILQPQVTGEVGSV